jgi:hypothetical protein
MAPDLHLRPLRDPSQIESLVGSEGVHLNNSSFVRISASRSERALIRGLTIGVLNFALTFGSNVLRHTPVDQPDLASGHFWIF